MRRFYFAIVLLSPFWLTLGRANADLTEILSSWTLESNSPQQMTTISDQFEIVSRNNQRYEIYVPENRIEDFKTGANSDPQFTDIAVDMEASPALNQRGLMNMKL